MSVEIYDGWYVNKGRYYFKTTDVNVYEPGDYQKYNIKLIYDYFSAQGWTLNAIAGMIGNMMVESGCNPGCCQYSSMNWDNPSTIQSSSGGIGLTQWTPARKYYDWAIANNLDPLSGDSQCARIDWESENNKQWSTDNILHYTWNDYINSTESPETLARVFVWAYERPANPDVAQRQRNARWVYNYLSGISPDPPQPPTPPDPDPPVPPTPDPPDEDWVMGEDLAYWADENINPDNTGIPIPYSQMNDAEFVSEAWGYVPVVNDNQWYLENSANGIWNSSSVYPTEDPTDPGSVQCFEIWFKDTISSYIENNNALPVGALIFKRESGTMVQVGIYMGSGMMMTSTPEKGVYKGRFIEANWTHFGFVCWVMPVNHYPEPPEPLSPTEILTLWYTTHRKDVTKNVKRSF